MDYGYRKRFWGTKEYAWCIWRTRWNTHPDMLFHNYKGFFSVALIPVYDANYGFTLIDISQYGSYNNSGVLNKSEMGKKLSAVESKNPRISQAAHLTLYVFIFFATSYLPTENGSCFRIFAKCYRKTNPFIVI